MAIFTLTDINFGDKRKEGSSGPLVGSEYESNTFRFPLDLGNYGRGHYIVFHINTQEKTSYPFTYTNDDPTIIANRKNFDTPSINTSFNKGVQGVGDFVNTLKNSQNSLVSGASNLVSSGLNGLNEATGGIMGDVFNEIKNYSRIEGARTIKRTTDTVALFMPDTVNFVTNQQFAELQMTGLPAMALSAGASAVDSKNTDAFTKNMTPFVANFFLNNKDTFGAMGQQMFAATFGMVQNPMLDVIYSSPAFRTFNFEFMFYPKSEKEAEQLQKIINRFQFHQCPEIRKEFNGFFLVPPSEFDIKFYYNGSENPNIQKMSTAVLEAINIDYAPNGYTAYEVPGQTKPTMGGTGMPVAIRMNLQFKEVEVLTKANFSSDPTRDAISKLGIENFKKVDWNNTFID